MNNNLFLTQINLAIYAIINVVEHKECSFVQIVSTIHKIEEFKVEIYHEQLGE